MYTAYRLKSGKATQTASNERKDLSLFDFEKLAQDIAYGPEEMVIDNNLYGQAYSLKRYAGIKHDLQAYIEHGLFWGGMVHHDEIIDGLKTLDFSVLKSRGEATSQLGKHISNAAVQQFLLKSLYWEEKTKLALRFNLDAIEQNINMVGEALFDDATYTGPSLFIDGELSNYIKPVDELLIKRHFPHARIETIPGSGHWVHAEQPELFYNCVASFLKNN